MANVNNEPKAFPQFVCPGEALTDMIRTGPDQWQSLVGGSTWNVARSLAKLGLRTSFAGAISQCLFGDALYHASKEANLDLRLLQRYAKSPLLAIVGETSPPDYFFIGDDAADLYFSPDDLPNKWDSELQWAHFGGISLARPRLAEKLIALAQQLKAQGIKISYDPNFRKLMDANYDHTLQTMCALADVIKVSDDDLIGLFRSVDLDQHFQTLRGFNPEAVVLYTRGAAGASLHVGQQVWQAAPPQIEVVDTVGAGDASIAGLLYSLCQHPERSWQQHLYYSVASGAAACLAAGAQAPTLEQIMPLYQTLNMD
ncbi:carbohydrate kinase [Undibacterium sp. LX40W]|uniref:Carbohydrate kinase n=1 Tax=Undibacterium nitidum TaxID=2762298 RepID=A0A923HUH4_9BURK|nr:MULTISPECIES: carbohydrate kinase [Undibacterium]MBC3881484.1 carbohydrate kinase [Undibacterium nitidum]MBC3891734.1 carbohydrate kinase [Undibacterium sp. LX40W]